MGIFSKITGALTLGLVGDDPFKFARTGATQAAKGAKEQAAIAGEEAQVAGDEARGLLEQTLAEQTAAKQEIGGIYDPRIQAGNQAFSDINQFYSGNQQPIIDQAQASPFMSSLVDAGESAIARNQQATGGFRSGTTQENLAGNEQNVLMSLVNQVLQGKQGIANSGSGAQDAYTVAMQNLIAGSGATRGNIANVGTNVANTRAGIGGQMANIGINQAASKQNMIGGLIGGLGKAVIGAV